MKLDLEYKDEKISALQKEMEELTTGGATDEEVSALKRQKHDLDLRLKDQVRLDGHQYPYYFDQSSLP